MQSIESLSAAVGPYSPVAPPGQSFLEPRATTNTNTNLNTNMNMNSSTNSNTNSSTNTNTNTIAKGGVATPFPYKLHIMLEAMEVEAAMGINTEGNKSIVCWQPHGRAFKVHKPRRFVEEIMPHFFNQTKYASFQRQLNLYGFQRITNPGPDKGAVHHLCFVRDQKHLVKDMVRRKVKGTKFRRTVAPEDQPDFYHHHGGDGVDVDVDVDVDVGGGSFQFRSKTNTIGNNNNNNNTISSSNTISNSNNSNSNNKPHPQNDDSLHRNRYHHLLQQQTRPTLATTATTTTIANNHHCSILQEAVNAVESVLQECNTTNNNHHNLQQAQWPSRFSIASPPPASHAHAPSYLYGTSWSSGW